MSKQIFPVENNVTLSIVKCQGDLVVRGWSRSAVRLQSGNDDFEVTQEGQAVMIAGSSDLRIDVPDEATIRVHLTQGDASIKRIRGDIQLELVQGDLALNQLGDVNVGKVQGDLSVRVIDRDLVVDTVEGDMQVRSVSGSLSVQHVGRDLGIRELGGDGSAQDVHGDVRLRMDFYAGRQYTFKAGGDIVARVSDQSHADLNLRSGRGQPRVKADLSEINRSGNELVARLGDGGAPVIMEAGRDLVLIVKETSEQTDWSDLGIEIGSLGEGFQLGFAGLADEIATQIEQQMTEMSVQLEEKLAAVANLDAKTARAAEKAHQQAERAAERLKRVAEKEAEKVRREASKARWKATRSEKKKPEELSSEPVTDEERLAILNMVAAGTISVEEAETLLAALLG